MLTQVLLNGLFASSLYCLVALGLTLILGVMDVADFAQGAIYMVGAFVAFLCSTQLGLHFSLALVVAVLVAVGLGVANNELIYQPVTRRSASTLIAALGVMLILQNIAVLIFGSDYQTYELPYGRMSVEVGAGVIPLYKLTVIAIAFGAIPLVWTFLTRTATGKAIRAMSQNREGAAIVGIGGREVSLITFAIGSALVGLAGALASPVYAFDAFFGADVIVKAFTIVIVGGMGSIPGVLVGVLIIGFGENLVSGYVSTEYSTLVTFLLLIIVLFLRPQGIFGKGQA
jgi:branched-chain amino acid transport system permease protein